MGLSIDNAIETIEYLKTQNSQLKSLDIAIDTMRKYQNIQGIIHCYNRYTDDAAECIDKLRRIIKDGR